MILGIYIMYGRSPGNEMCAQLQPKKTKVRRLYQLLVLQQKASYVLYITNKMEHSPCH